jgi:hypothetical protein
MRISEIEIPDTIDGKPTRNNLGQLIHPTIEGIRNFWRWFGDSKVVDSQGRPLVVYHGTPKNIGNPDPSKAVRLSGFWMTPGRKIANAYAAAGVRDAMTYREGANVLSLYVKVENPRVYHPRREPISKAWGEYTEGGFDGFFELQGGGFYSISVPDAKQIKSATGNNGNFSVSNNKITEIGFAHALGELSIPHSEIVAKSVKDGTIFGNPVRVFTSGESKLYFFEHENEIAALVLVDGNFVRAIKSFNGEKGLVFALVNYLVSIKNIKLKIDASEPLTDEGFRWLLKMVSDNSGIKVRDTSGEVVDPAKLRSEWTQSKNTMGTQSGPTGFTISESSEAWKTKLQMNEKRIIPFVYFNC